MQELQELEERGGVVAHYGHPSKHKAVEAISPVSINRFKIH